MKSLASFANSSMLMSRKRIAGEGAKHGALSGRGTAGR